MKFPEWTKPGFYGAVIGAIVAPVVGFGWGDWTTSSNAETMAKSFAKTEVIRTLVPVCLEKFWSDPERVAKLDAIREATPFNKGKEVMKAGWATPPGTETPDRELAKACVEGLELNDS